jgi:ubiquinone/menaquinone biosynthesis C-methylase UbiE
MALNSKQYSEQDRGDSDRYNKYLSGMDSVIVEKIASASVYFPHIEGTTIVDIGMASGTGTYILAVLFPKCKVIGVDVNPKMVEIANKTHQLPNLEFIIDDGEKLEKLEQEKIIGFFNCSSIHHITSFNDYSPHKAYLTIKRQTELLKEGGVIVIRDFVKPEDRDIIIEFSKDDEGKSNSQLLQQFSKTARSLSAANQRGFPLIHLEETKFRINQIDAIEFVRRKDYLADWEVELQEEYGYYSQEEFEQAFSEMGLRTIASGPIYNPWIIKNRYNGKFKITDLDGNDLGFPATNYIIAGEKVGSRGTKLQAIRHLPIADESFIKLNSYRNVVTEDVFDVAQRPFPVIDILPYYTGTDGNIKIITKHGYPRPIVNQINKRETIDKKNYSGYLTESITAMKGALSENNLVAETLSQRASIKKELINQTDKSLTFYTSPGGIDELVESYHVELKTNNIDIVDNQKSNFSGFIESGQIREHDAIQLLKSIQVGALPDVRLEINLYNLFYKKIIDFGNWLNDKLVIKSINELPSEKLTDLLENESSQKYESISTEVGFLKQFRTKFYEYKRENSTSIFEYVVPDKTSLNTVVTLPVYSCHGKIYLGIESRFLPVPQIQEGNSFILTAPAYRMPKNITSVTKLEKYISALSIGDSTVEGFTKLGEKYLPCPGMTPEQVYPYIVNLSQPTKSLHWIPLDELFKERHRIRDGHLLLAIFRVLHAI